MNVKHELKSLLLTFLVALPIEAGGELVRVAEGDLSRAAFLALGIAFLRAFVKVLVYSLFPTLKGSEIENKRVAK